MAHKIQAVVDTNYYLAKSLLMDFEEHDCIDPAEKLLFLYASLENKDTAYFKNEMEKLIVHDGFKYTNDPFSLESTDTRFCLLLQEHQLENWMITTSGRLFPEWIINHPENYEVRQILAKILVKD